MAIPVLLAARPKQCEGHVVEFDPTRKAGRSPVETYTTKHVRVVPSDSLELFINPKSRKQFAEVVGTVSERNRKALLAVFGRAQTIPTIQHIIKSLRAPMPSTAVTTALDHHKDVLASIPGIRIGSTAQFKVKIVEGWEWSQQNNAETLSLYVNQALREARLVLWWVELERKLAVGLYCDTPTAALFALAFQRLGKPGAIATCFRCQTAFITRRGKHPYCSTQCQTAAAMVRYRDRKKHNPRSSKHAKRKVKRER